MANLVTMGGQPSIPRSHLFSIGWQFPIESPRLILLTLKTERFQDFSICHVKQGCVSRILPRYIPISICFYFYFPHLRTILKTYSTERVHTSSVRIVGNKLAQKSTCWYKLTNSPFIYGFSNGDSL